MSDNNQKKKTPDYSDDNIAVWTNMVPKRNDDTGAKLPLHNIVEKRTDGSTKQCTVNGSLAGLTLSAEAVVKLYKGKTLTATLPSRYDKNDTFDLSIAVRNFNTVENTNKEGRTTYMNLGVATHLKNAEGEHIGFSIDNSKKVDGEFKKQKVTMWKNLNNAGDTIALDLRDALRLMEGETITKEASKSHSVVLGQVKESTYKDNPTYTAELRASEIIDESENILASEQPAIETPTDSNLKAAV